MVDLRINMAGFKRACQDVRDSGSFDREWEDATTLTERKDVYRDHCDFVTEWFRPATPAARPTYESHLSALTVASRNAYLSGATDKQIALLARLHVEAGEWFTYGEHALTKAQASRLIDVFQGAK